MSYPKIRTQAGKRSGSCNLIGAECFNVTRAIVSGIEPLSLQCKSCITAACEDLCIEGSKFQPKMLVIYRFYSCQLNQETCSANDGLSLHLKGEYAIDFN